MFAGLAAGVWVRRFSLHSFPIISMISHPVLYIGVSSFLFQPFSSLNGFGKSNWIFGETMRKNWYKLFSQRHCLILWLFVVHLRLFGLSACCCVAFQGEPAFARHNSNKFGSALAYSLPSTHRIPAAWRRYDLPHRV